MKDDYILRIACKAIYWSGGGSNWFEEGAIGNDKSWVYLTISFIVYSFFLFTASMEVMAATIESLTKDEKFYAASHGIVHMSFMLKVIIAIFKRGCIKKLVYNMIRACHSIDDDEIAKKKYKEIKYVCLIYFFCMYGSTFMYIVRGIINMLSGHYFYILITYYAPPGDDSEGARYFRIGTAFMALFIVSAVTNVDGLVISSMVIYKYKFVLLKKYFKMLNDEYESSMSQPGCDVNAASNKLSDGLKEGVIMHIEVIRLSGEIDESLGILTATQLFSTSFPAVFQLLQVAFSDSMNVLDSLKVLSFIFTVFLLLGIYLTTIGDITEEAATLTDSIFYCGWYLCPSTVPAHRKIRALVLISSALSQQPISMKAFKMIELTHATYIKVIKSTYSVYALLRAQN